MIERTKKGLETPPMIYGKERIEKGGNERNQMVPQNVYSLSQLRWLRDGRRKVGVGSSDLS